jgi:hypothetical protein
MSSIYEFKESDYPIQPSFNIENFKKIIQSNEIDCSTTSCEALATNCIYVFHKYKCEHDALTLGVTPVCKEHFKTERQDRKQGHPILVKKCTCTSDY